MTGLGALLAVGLAVVPASAAPSTGAGPNAQPQGGHVVGGAATISLTPSSVVINQSTERSVIDWQSFDIGAQQSVLVQQPNSSAVTYLRVVGSDASAITGRLTANGSVVLVNAAGVGIHQGAQIEVASIAISTADASGDTGDTAIMGGKPIALSTPGKPNAAVTNAGAITAKRAGLVALIAPSVTNSGTVGALLGSINMIAARTATLMRYGESSATVQITSGVRRVPDGANGKPVTHLIGVPGTLSANGGRIRIAGNAADGIVQNVIGIGGRLHANTASEHRGRITVSALGGSASITGLLGAVGAGAGTTGGTVCVLATDGLALATGGQITVSGRAAAGSVGFGIQAEHAARHKTVCAGSHEARTVNIGAKGSIHADGLGTGNGGTIDIGATRKLNQSGPITARGGHSGGNGGFVEFDAGGVLTSSSTPDVSAPHGTAGTIVY